VDHGVPGQVAMRATFGYWGARILTSGYRVVAVSYWFAAQVLACALGVQALVEGLIGQHWRLGPTALVLGAVQVALAAFGFDVLRWVVKVVLPLALVFLGVMLALYLGSDDPRFAASRVFHSQGHRLTWVGFATFVTVMVGSSLTLVTNASDFVRYTRSR